MSQNCYMCHNVNAISYCDVAIINYISEKLMICIKVFYLKNNMYYEIIY